MGLPNCRLHGVNARVAMMVRRQSIALEAVPDIILCDLGLPGGMDGFAVARACRAEAIARKSSSGGRLGLWFFGRSRERYHRGI